MKKDNEDKKCNLSSLLFADVVIQIVYSVETL